MMPNNTDTYIALYGAFERDNFGDILFLNVTKKLLESWPIISLSVLSRDMNIQGAGNIFSATAWFDNCGDFRPCALVIVGGEALITSVTNAIHMDLDEAHAELFRSLQPVLKQRVAKSLLRKEGLAYIPDVIDGRGHDFRSIKMAFNSVGGTALGESSGGAVLLQNAVDRAEYISVRDNETFFRLRKMTGVTPELAPDIVNLLPQLFEKEIAEGLDKLKQHLDLKVRKYMVFQANSAFIERSGLEVVASALAEVMEEHAYGFVFQPAGAAPWHDSFELLEQLRDAVLAKKHFKEFIKIQESRDVWIQSALIGHSACFIGTSLHGRIVATAFGTSRVSLENNKVACYAETWEKGVQPVQVDLSNLSNAVSSAIKVDPTILSRLANDLQLKAKKGFLRLREVLEISEFQGDVEEIYRSIGKVREKSLLYECEWLRNGLVEIAGELSLAKRKGDSLDSILASRSWKVLTKLKSLIRRF